MAKQAIIGDAASGRYIKLWQSGGFLTCGVRLLKDYTDPGKISLMITHGDRHNLYGDPAKLWSDTPMNQALDAALGAAQPHIRRAKGSHLWFGDFWTHPQIDTTQWHFRYLFENGQWYAGRCGIAAVAPLAEIMAVLKPAIYPAPAGTKPGDFSSIPNAVSLALR